ncbi:MAG: hypothetical protein QOD86_915 [Miltoncostaeaceae bacterium]|nr:hypothetical protein [Miltoncostaeaceae bacterium]
MNTTRIAKPDRAATTTALLAALEVPDGRLGAVVRAVAEAVGAQAAVLWRPESEGRLLLAHRHGDEALAAEEDVLLSGGADRNAEVSPLPLELPPWGDAEPGVIQLRGHPFAALGLGGPLLAVGPLARDRLTPRQRRRLVELAGLSGAAVREALRAGAMETELAVLRAEIEMGHRALGSTIDESRSFKLLLELAVGTTGSTGGFVAARGGDGRFRISASRNLPEGFTDLDLTPGSGVLADIPELPGVLIVEGFEALQALGIGGLLAVSGPAGSPEPPLVFGLISDDETPLPADCTTLLATLVDQAALVLESSEVARATGTRHLEALEGLCRALVARSPESLGHHERVRAVADEIAERLSLDPSLRRLLADAARVHDAGLVAGGGEDAIAVEFAHPTLGAEMVSLVPGAAHLAPLVRSHHEWWDGFGFPAGLIGESIPLAGRVLAAAELYVETLEGGLAADRPALIAELAARRGTQLDPVCADALLDIAKEST